MRRASKVGFAAVVGSVAVVGALHLPFARPLLMYLGGCPADRVSPAAIEAARIAAIRDARGTTVAPERPALGLTLDAATLDDVRAWAKRVGAACDEKRAATFIRCRGAAGYTEVAFGISPHTRRVVAVTTLTSSLSKVDGASALRRLTADLRAKLGDPTSAAGDVDALEKPGFHTATVAYRFTDYLATVTATDMPGRGVSVRAEYLSATQ